jgi:hypothetical protein
VSDTITPIISSPEDFSYEEGESIGPSWTITDFGAGTYTVYLDDEVFVSSDWISGNTIGVFDDSLAIGEHNFTIFVMDQSGNFAVDTVIVTVLEVDTFDPIISSPVDITYSEGETSNIISWTATDLNAATYVITRNGTEVDTGSWVSGTAITFDVDGLAEGVYTFTIEVIDQKGNTASDTVIVTVTGADTTGDPKDDDDGGNVVIIVIVVVVALGGAGAGAFVYMKKK